MQSSLSNHSVIDAEYPLLEKEPKPDIDLFPLYYQAEKIECNLTAGDILYLPQGWWHWIFSESETIAVNFWFHTTVKSYSDLSQIDITTSSISESVYRQDYLAKNQPLLLKQGAKSWKAIALWQRDYLVTINDLMIPQFCAGYGEHSSFAPVHKPHYTIANHNDKMRLFSQLTFQKLDDKIDRHPELNYVAFIPFLEQSRLSEDIIKPDLLTNQNINSINLWYSYGKIHTGLHYDDYENILVVLKGNKRVFLYPPNQGKFLYSQTLPMLFNYVKVESLEGDHSI